MNTLTSFAGPFFGLGIAELIIFLLVIVLPVAIIVQIVRYVKKISTASFSPADELAKFKKLLDEGTINQAEYDKKKAELLK